MNPKALWNDIAPFVITRFVTTLFVVTSITAVTMVVAAPGWASSATTGGISGTYQVVGKTEAGAQTRVRLKVHLTNHGQTLVHVERLGLENAASSVRTAHKEKTQACSVTIAAGGAG